MSNIILPSSTPINTSWNSIKNFSNSAYNTLKNYINKSNYILSGQQEFDMQKELLKEQQLYNSAEAEKNRQFQMEMSNTAFQRQAEDLKKTGLNPALVLSNGGANMVATSTAQSSLPNAPNITNSASNVKISALTNLTNAINNTLNSATSVYNNKKRNETSTINTLISGLFKFIGE